NNKIEKYDITPAPRQIVANTALKQPALIFVEMNHWHEFALPFVENSPTLDSPIVYAIDVNPTITQQVREQYQDRTCWQLRADYLERCPE
ncbi:MAG: hypothetical protein AAF485_22520, partial [Chloroflexota bacterium]